MKADLPAFIREADALRRLQGQRWAIEPDPVIVRLERALAPFGRALRRAFG